MRWAVLRNDLGQQRRNSRRLLAYVAVMFSDNVSDELAKRLFFPLSRLRSLRTALRVLQKLQYAIKVHMGM